MSDPVDQQHPVLTNPSGASLDGKPWSDPSGFGGPMGGAFRVRPIPAPWPAARSSSSAARIRTTIRPGGAGPEHWIHTDQVLPFEVLFENKPTAAAPAQEVLVTDLLSTNLDWSTFELKTIAFNDARITVPAGLQRFYTTTQVSSDTNR